MAFAPRDLTQPRLKSFVHQLLPVVKGTPGCEHVKQAQCQEWVARMFGFAHWHEAVTTLKDGHPLTNRPISPAPFSDVVIVPAGNPRVSVVLKRMEDLGHRTLVFQAHEFRAPAEVNAFVLDEAAQAGLLLDFLSLDHQDTSDPEQVIGALMGDARTLDANQVWVARARDLLHHLMPFWSHGLMARMMDGGLTFAHVRDLSDGSSGDAALFKKKNLRAYVEDMENRFVDSSVLDEQHAYLTMHLSGALKRLAAGRNRKKDGFELAVAKDGHRLTCQLTGEHPFGAVAEAFLLRHLMASSARVGFDTILIEFTNAQVRDWFPICPGAPPSMALVVLRPGPLDDEKHGPAWARNMPGMKDTAWLDSHPFTQ